MDSMDRNDQNKMEEFLGKKYVLTRMENFEEYLNYLGFNYISRKLALNVRPVESLARNEDGTYTFSQKCALYDWDIVFTPGVEFDERKPYGKMVKASITLEDNKMIHIQDEGNGKISTHVIEYTADKSITTTTAKGFDKVVKRIYETAIS